MFVRRRELEEEQVADDRGRKIERHAGAELRMRRVVDHLEVEPVNEVQAKAQLGMPIKADRDRVRGLQPKDGQAKVKRRADRDRLPQRKVPLDEISIRITRDT